MGSRSSFSRPSTPSARPARLPTGPPSRAMWSKPSPGARANRKVAQAHSPAAKRAKYPAHRRGALQGEEIADSLELFPRTVETHRWRPGGKRRPQGLPAWCASRSGRGWSTVAARWKFALGGNRPRAWVEHHPRRERGSRLAGAMSCWIRAEPPMDRTGEFEEANAFEARVHDALPSTLPVDVTLAGFAHPLFRPHPRPPSAGACVSRRTLPFRSATSAASGSTSRAGGAWMSMRKASGRPSPRPSARC